MEHVSDGSEKLHNALNASKGTGEHGVGVGKKEYLVGELGPSTVKLMRTVKDAIDPLDIMNPGKVRLQGRRGINRANDRAIALPG